MIKCLDICYSVCSWIHLLLGLLKLLLQNKRNQKIYYFMMSYLKNKRSEYSVLCLKFQTPQ